LGRGFRAGDDVVEPPDGTLPAENIVERLQRALAELKNVVRAIDPALVEREPGEPEVTGEGEQWLRRQLDDRLRTHRASTRAMNRVIRLKWVFGAL
jgi:hypothetical protein